MVPIKEALTFDDVTLAPKYSEILPSDADTSVSLTKHLKLKIPLLSSAMDTVTESRMAIAIAKAGGIGVIHRNLDIKKQLSEIKKVKKQKLIVGAAVGAAPNEFIRAKEIIKEGVDLIVVDTAHGHTKKVAEIIKYIKKIKTNKIALCAGNIATPEAAKDLIKLGADAIKVGIGPGSICTTRIVAGVGVPQFTAIQDIATITNKNKIPMISDGGIRYSGDIVKALAAGANCIMAGSLFAGTDESPGEVFLFQGRSYKSYRGMGSLGAMARGSADRYFQDEINEAIKLVPEGIEGRIPYKGQVSNVLFQLTGGLRSGMGYTGSKNLTILKKNAKFVRLTNSGINESHVHGVQVTKEAPNYRSN